MMALLNANPDLRIVMKEFPILAEGSVEAARISVAVKDIDPQQLSGVPPGAVLAAGRGRRRQGAGGRQGPRPRRGRAEDGGGGCRRHRQHQGSAPARRRRSASAARPPTSSATELVPGAIGYDALQEKVAAIRKCGATTCDRPQALTRATRISPRRSVHERIFPAVLHLVERADARHPLLDLARGRVRRRRRVRQPLLSAEGRRPPLGDLQRRGRGLAHPRRLARLDAPPHRHAADRRTPTSRANGRSRTCRT